MSEAGFQISDLSPISISLNAANRSPIWINGAFHATIKGRFHLDELIVCHSRIYVSHDMTKMYPSYYTMVALGILNHEYPMVGQFSLSANPMPSKKPSSTSSDRTDNSTGRIWGATKIDGQVCQYPKQNPLPYCPTALSFICTSGNNDRMHNWLLDYYGSSTFNPYPDQVLHVMAGLAVEIYLKDNVTPVARHKTIPVPIHWQGQAHTDLLRDELLGVLLKQWNGSVAWWLLGSPRRIVNLSALNKHCQRETHNAESPFHLARRIPHNTWKMVTDACNGYHSVPLQESDCHLTTFITPFGCWHHKRAPQGFLSSGDSRNC